MPDEARPDTPPARYRLAVDIGGTFVDAVELDRDTRRIRFRKASTTPRRPWEGVLDAFDALGTDLAATELFIHGTTLGLNAILERRGARVGIIANEGLRDVFLMGRGNVPESHMYDFTYRRPPAIVARRDTVGVVGRLDAHGEVVTELDEDSVRAAARYLVEESGVTSIAVCLLHSYRDPVHEHRVAEIVREMYPHVHVAVSADIAPEHREYERTSTAVLDAYIRPIFERYVDRLETELAERSFDGHFLITRSGGGAMTSAAARLAPTTTVLSGPAGGVVGASFVARLLGRDDLISVDIGGTSLDAAVFERGEAAVVHEAELEQMPLLIPVYDIRTIGAGGGSIASLDKGMLQVGPRSAGAEPGPICYRRGGTEPTTTDAAVVLGYIDPGGFLGGDMALDVDGAREGVRVRLAEPLGMSVEDAAAGVFSVMLAKTVGAIRQITVERGRDPRGFSMLAFGGAGPLLTPMLGREVGVVEVIVPQAPSAFSAWGMLSADVAEDASRTVLRTLEQDALPDLAAGLDELAAEVTELLRAQDVTGGGEVVVQRELELRYLGQEHALRIAVGTEIADAETLRKAFGERHQQLYGHAMDNEVQVLNLRVRGVARLEQPELPRIPTGDADPAQARSGERLAYDFATGEMTTFAVYRRDLLEAGDVVPGPALVEEGTSVTVVHGDQACTVDEYGHLLIRGATK
ncbi:hydantoinase/oxoprolinase family protein [Sphaerimonospora mesophila]|uniref:hydantoinase/oxoprolinase family protein n=1 Tax=Sphaerimonospora mesophila TaxID=37483 RepID=UPI0006E1EADE